MPELQELAVALFIVVANIAACLGGLLAFSIAWRNGRSEGVRIPVLLYPLTLAVLGAAYWHFLRRPLGEGAPVFTDSLLRSVMGLLAITAAPCLVWLSPAIIAVVWRRSRLAKN
jgi:hypothetical protein